MTTNIFKVEDIRLLDQECSGDCSFAGPLYCTSALLEKLGNQCYSIILEALSLVHERVATLGADYLQVFLLSCGNLNDEKMYLVDDISHVTALLASDY